MTINDDNAETTMPAADDQETADAPDKRERVSDPHALTIASDTLSSSTDPSQPAPPSAVTLTLPPQTLAGATLEGRYFIEKELGHGGVGVVYLARDRKLHDKPVVVKVLLEQSLRDQWVLRKFQQEKEALARVDHPGVVGILDTGELPDGKPFIVMQYIDGAALRSVLSQHGMDLERAALLIRQIGAALSAVHQKGIYHRDLKPENIMLQHIGSPEEQVKIVDFGIARVKQSEVSQSTITGGSTAGTIVYMSPEQLRGEKVGAASDVYAMGVIAYEMVTGRRPFNPESPFELLDMQRAGVRVKPVDLRPSLSTEAQDIILNTLNFAAHDRYQAARDFGDALSRALINEDETLKLESKRIPEIPPTRLATAPTPAPLPTSDQPVKTLVSPVDRIDPRTFGDAASWGGGQASPARGNSGLKVLLAIIIVAVLGGGIYLVVANRVALFGKPTTPPAAGPVIERSLTYSLTVQKFHNKAAYDAPFETSGQEIFENGWKFQMNITSPQEGYLYLLNEGPAANGEITYNLLFPEPHTNGGSAKVSVDHKLQTARMRFDDNQGTEKFWIVWSATPVKEIDDVTSVVNAREQGAVTNPDQVKAIRDFLARHSAPKPEVAKDAAGEQTIVKGKGDVLVSNVELKHH